MSIAPLYLPAWIKTHRVFEQKLADIPERELASLRLRLQRFRHQEAVVSIIMPAFNEEKYILRAISSISHLQLVDQYPTEFWVINDASTDQTQTILDSLGVQSFVMPTNSRPKGARQKGLELAKGTYLLQVDADTLYPPNWGIAYIEALQNRQIALAYGSHSFVADGDSSRLSLALHETIGSILYAIRRRKRPYINVHGFNSAFLRETALAHGSYEHTPTGSEDGHMALMLNKVGRLQFINRADCRAWTSDRRIMADGGLWKGFLKRAKKEGARIWEYMSP